MADKKPAKAKKQDNGGLRGKVAVDAVLFHYRMAAFHRASQRGEVALQHQRKGDEIYATLPADRQGIVRMVAPQLGLPKEGPDNFVEYAVPTRPQGKVTFISVPLSEEEKAQLKAIASRSPEGNMASFVAMLVRSTLKEYAAIENGTQAA